MSQRTARIIAMIVGAIIGGFVGWLVGLFYHCCWWFVTLMSFDITSGIIRYTWPYAAIGVVLGACWGLGGLGLV